MPILNVHRAEHIVTICAWCPEPERKPLGAALERAGWEVSHGMCPACFALEMSRQDRQALEGGYLTNLPIHKTITKGE